MGDTLKANRKGRKEGKEEQLTVMREEGKQEKKWMHSLYYYKNVVAVLNLR